MLEEEREVLLMVAADFFRKQIQKAANDVVAKLKAWTKDPSSIPKGLGDVRSPANATEAGGTEADAAAGGAAGANGDGKGQKAGLTVEKPGEGSAEPDEPKFSWQNLGIARQLLVVGGAIGITLGIFLFFKQAKR